MKKSEVVRLKQVDHVKHEKQILWDITHPFIANLYTTFSDERNLYLMLEHVEGGPLLKYLRDRGKFVNDHTRFYAAQIVMALQSLHNETIVYRDLKPENLLLDSHGYLKMTDFLYAKKVAADDKTWTLCGTPEYLAPEMIQTKGHNMSVDWWALGIVIYEMLAGYPPFFDETPFGIYQKILAGNYEFPRHFESHAKDLLRKLLAADRGKRIGCLKNGAEDIKKHKWYRGLNWAALYNKQLDSNMKPLRDKAKGAEKFPDSNEESGPLLKEAKNHELFGHF